MFNSIFRAAIQSYLSTAISTFLAFHAFKSETTADKLRAFVTIPMVFLVFYFPYFSYWCQRTFITELHLKQTKQSFGSLYTNIDYYKLRALSFTMLFLYRRLAFAWAVVYATDSLVYQMTVTLYSSLAMMIYLACNLPMMDTFTNVVQLINELALYVCCCTMFLFTDYISDPVFRYRIGWFYLACTGLNIAFNVLMLIISIIIDGRKKLRMKSERDESLRHLTAKRALMAKKGIAVEPKKSASQVAKEMRIARIRARKAIEEALKQQSEEEVRNDLEKANVKKEPEIEEESKVGEEPRIEEDSTKLEDESKAQEELKRTNSAIERVDKLVADFEEVFRNYPEE